MSFGGGGVLFKLCVYFFLSLFIFCFVRKRLSEAVNMSQKFRSTRQSIGNRKQKSRFGGVRGCVISYTVFVKFAEKKTFRCQFAVDKKLTEIQCSEMFTPSREFEFAATKTTGACDIFATEFQCRKWSLWRTRRTRFATL